MSEEHVELAEDLQRASTNNDLRVWARGVPLADFEENVLRCPVCEVVKPVPVERDGIPYCRNCGSRLCRHVTPDLWGQP